MRNCEVVVALNCVGSRRDREGLTTASGVKLDVILPAGGRIQGAFAAHVGVQIKALLPLGERTVLERMLEALHATGRVERAVVVGPDEIAEHRAAAAADVVLPETGSGPGNVFRGLEWLENAGDSGLAERVLILATDLPFLTPESVTGFLNACPQEADIALPIVGREAFQARFPDGPRRRFVRLRGGPIVMGCAFVVNSEALARNRDHLVRVFAARKLALGVFAKLGPVFLARFALGRLTVADIEERSEQVLACRCAAVRDCAPELAFDVDGLQDYRYAVAREG